MLFPSITFLFYFLPLFFVLYCVAPGVTAKNVVLLAASLLFYAWGEPRFVLLLAGQIVLNYAFALAIGAARRQAAAVRDRGSASRRTSRCSASSNTPTSRSARSMPSPAARHSRCPASRCRSVFRSSPSTPSRT